MNLRYLSVFIMLFAGQLCAFALDPGLPPSGNFDLGTWKVTLPDQTEEDVASLIGGFESANEFYTDPVTGAMVFRCPNDGATGGSSYPRSELREMLRGTNTGPSTQGFSKNNWVFSTATQQHQDDTAGVDGNMTATLTVDHVSTTASSSSMIGRVIIGQIHASGDEPCRLYYRKLPGNSLGSIYIAHEPTDATGRPEEWYDMIGSRSSSASNPSDGIALGEQFSYEIDVVGNDLNVTIIRPGKPDVTQYVDMSLSGHGDDWMYFKAGCYNQANGGSAGEYAQVSFYALTKSHNISGNVSPTCSITSPAHGANFNEGDPIVIDASASDTDGTISKVEFYYDGILLGEDTSSPYSFTWTNALDGSYSLTAKATDDGGAETTSAAVGIAVLAGPNTPPTCSITAPAGGSIYTEGTSVIIDANASDTDGTISKVEFYRDAILLGEDTSAPYSYTWNNIPDGNFSLTAKAIDDNFAETTSTAVNITVNPSAILTSEDFESAFGNWVNVGGDTHDWKRDENGTSSNNTGPDDGANGSDWYIYMETSAGTTPPGANDPGDTAYLEGPELTNGFDRVLTFFYHMHGNTMGTLNVDVHSGGSWNNAVWSRSGEQHGDEATPYTQASVDLSAYSGTIRIRFRGVAVGGVRGDMAIDDIEVTTALPPSTYTITPSAGPNGSILPAAPVVVNAGAATNFIISAAADYHIEDVLVDLVSIGSVGSYSFTNVMSDHSISATFALDPILTIETVGSDVVLSWPTNGSSGFNLVSSTNLTDWSAAGVPSQVGDSNYMTNSTTGTNTFYRLIRP